MPVTGSPSMLKGYHNSLIDGSPSILSNVDVMNSSYILQKWNDRNLPLSNKIDGVPVTCIPGVSRTEVPAVLECQCQRSTHIYHPRHIHCKPHSSMHFLTKTMLFFISTISMTYKGTTIRDCTTRISNTKNTRLCKLPSICPAISEIMTPQNAPKLHVVV